MSPPVSPNVRSTAVWDKKFFQDFTLFKNKIYQAHADFISEDQADIEIFLGPDAFYSKRMKWTAVLIENVGRYILSTKPGDQDLYLGYFECIGDRKYLQERLFSDIQAFRQNYPEIRNVKGPIQASLFAGYRFREPTNTPRFMGESLHQDFYPALWQEWGFQVDEYWDSYSFQTESGRNFYMDVESKFQRFWQDPKLIYRHLDMKNWDQEIKAIYEITMEAYDLKGTNHEIDFSTFKFLSEKIKPILKPDLVSLLEYDNQIVAFNICYPDIQAEIRSYNKRKSYLLPWLNKLILVLQIQFRKHPLLLVYVAKRKNCPIKWAMAKLACGMARSTDTQKFPTSVSVLNAQSSGSRSSLPHEKSLHSRHFLMSLHLSS